jgi:hypothetical protein
MKGASTRLRFAALIAVFGLASSACGTGTQAIDPSRVLHVINLTTRTIGIEVGTHDLGGPTYDSAVRPCSELTAVAGAQNVPTEGDLLVWLFVDPTSNLDVSVANWSGDPFDMPGNYTASILWSSGEIRASDLPRWIVVTPSHTSIETTAPAAVSTCSPMVLDEGSPAPTPADSTATATPAATAATATATAP